MKEHIDRVDDIWICSVDKLMQCIIDIASQCKQIL